MKPPTARMGSIHRSRLHAWLLAAALASLPLLPSRSFGAEQPALSAQNLGSGGATAAVPGGKLPAWWSYFHDSTLNLLLSMARSRGVAGPTEELRLEAEVTELYIQARIYTMREIAALAIEAASKRQLALQQENGPATPEQARLARSRIDHAAGAAEQFRRLRAKSLAEMGERLGGGQAAAVLSVLLEPALRDSRLPLPKFEMPLEVPALLLRLRPDVAQAEVQLAQQGRSSAEEQMRLVRYVQSISGFISPIQDAGPDDAQNATTLQPEDILARARREVGYMIWLLTERAAAADQKYRDAKRLKSEYEVLKGRFASGQATETELLELLVPLLVAEDDLTAAGGAVSMAWIAFQYSMAGAGHAPVSAALGAGSQRAHE